MTVFARMGCSYFKKVSINALRRLDNAFRGFASRSSAAGAWLAKDEKSWQDRPKRKVAVAESLLPTDRSPPGEGRAHTPLSRASAAQRSLSLDPRGIADVGSAAGAALISGVASGTARHERCMQTTLNQPGADRRAEVGEAA
jgi:hypothetical protein